MTQGERLVINSMIRKMKKSLDDPVYNSWERMELQNWINALEWVLWRCRGNMKRSLKRRKRNC